jgi:hypothetical protein
MALSHPADTGIQPARTAVLCALVVVAGACLVVRRRHRAARGVTLDRPPPGVPKCGPPRPLA